MNLVKKIKEFPIFAGLKNNQLKEIVSNSFAKNLIADEKLFLINEKRDIFFVVVEGEIAIIRQLGQLNQVVEIVNQGEYIAEMALFNPQQYHSHSAQANSKHALVMGLPGKLFPKLSLPTRYQLLLNLLPIISDNFSHASNRIMTILQIGETLSTQVGDVAVLGKTILHTLLQAIQAEKALIVLGNRNSTSAQVRATYGFKPKEDPLDKNILLKKDYILKTVFQKGEAVNVPKSEYLKHPKLIKYINGSVLATPLSVLDKTIGAIILINKSENRNFNTNNEVLLNTTAKMASLGIYQSQQFELKQAEQELHREYISI